VFLCQAIQPNMDIVVPPDRENVPTLPRLEMSNVYQYLRDLQTFSLCHKDQLDSFGWCIIIFIIISLSIHNKIVCSCATLTFENIQIVGQKLFNYLNIFKTTDIYKTCLYGLKPKMMPYLVFNFVLLGHHFK